MSRSIHLFHQKPNPARETVPLTLYFNLPPWPPKYWGASLGNLLSVLTYLLGWEVAWFLYVSRFHKNIYSNAHPKLTTQERNKPPEVTAHTCRGILWPELLKTPKIWISFYLYLLFLWEQTIYIIIVCCCWLTIKSDFPISLTQGVLSHAPVKFLNFDLNTFITKK